MKKSLCIYIQVHLPAYLRDYRFFDIGHSHYYFDEFNIKNNILRMAEESYLPLNKIMLEEIQKRGKDIKLALSISGEVLDQMEKFCPKALDSFKALADTGCVEFVCETYSHSITVLGDEKEFKAQVEESAKAIKKHFGQTPKTLRLTGMIYSDQIGEMAANMGYKTMLTENAKHVMGWKSPNFVYSSAGSKKVNLLLRNSKISERISFYFADQSKSYWPITCEKVVSWLNEIDPKEELVNLFMDYAAFGDRNHHSTGIFEFMRHLPQQVLSDNKFELLTPSEVVKKHTPTNTLEIPYPISWSEAECDLSVWFGNNMQKDAYRAICELGDRVRFVNDESITADWKRLQDSDHFYFMCTRWQADQRGRRFRSPYKSPYDAYINYMNVVSDLNQRVDYEIDDTISNLMEDQDFSDKVIRSGSLSLHDFKYTEAQINKIIDIVSTEQKNQSKAKKGTTKIELLKD